MIFKSQYCFVNIFATKAPIFLKFETYIYKTVKNYQMIFRKDPCSQAHTRGVNVCARVCMDLYEKSFDDSLLSYEHKSQIS